MNLAELKAYKIELEILAKVVLEPPRTPMDLRNAADIQEEWEQTVQAIRIKNAILTSCVN